MVLQKTMLENNSLSISILLIQPPRFTNQFIFKAA